MSFRPPEVLEELFDLPLQNGNVHRIQFVRFSDRPSAVVSLECREYVIPSLISSHRFPIVYHDARGWGMGMTKGLRAEHLEWMFENRERVRAGCHRHRVATMQLGIDGWGRKV